MRCSTTRLLTTLAIASNRDMDNPVQGTKLNFGCGSHQPSGWVNGDIDISVFPDGLDDHHVLLEQRPLERALGYADGDITYLPFPDGDVQQVMMCHVLEHIRPEDVVRTLREVRRVLRVGGQLLIICPDIRVTLKHMLDLPLCPRGNPQLGGAVSFSDPPKPISLGQTPWTMEEVVRLLFADVVLEDDPIDPELPRSGHKWNTYGSRLLNVVKRVFPSTVLLPQTYRSSGRWNDPDSGYEWPTSGWRELTCAVLATVTPQGP